MEHTSFPSGKQRQKKSGRGRPTAFFIASVTTPVISTANKRPALVDRYITKLMHRDISK